MGSIEAIAKATPLNDVSAGSSAPRSTTRFQARRPSPAGFPFGFGGRAKWLTVLFTLALSGRGRRRLPRKSGGPTLFAPSFEVQRDRAHDRNSG